MNGPAAPAITVLPWDVVIAVTIVCLLASLFECLIILPAHYMDFGTKATAAGVIAKGGGSLSYRARARTDETIVRMRQGYLRALEAVLLLRVAPSEVADAFVASRIAEPGAGYGLQPPAVDPAPLLARALSR